MDTYPCSISTYPQHLVRLVLWVGTDTAWVGSQTFIRLAADINYDCGYGSAEIDRDLMVAGDGWWLERGEYDGAEWWEYKRNPTQPPHEGFTFREDARYQEPRFKVCAE